MPNYQGVEERGCTYVHKCLMDLVKSPSPSTHQPEGFTVYIDILFFYILKLDEK